MSLTDYPLIADWLRVAPDRLHLRTGKVDIGQRISSALTQIAHEELTLPHVQIAVDPVRTGDSPDEGMTSGSNSIEHSGHALRLAAATLRGRALAWAAEQSGGAPEDWTLEDGALTRPGANRPIPLLGLLQGRDLALPVDTGAPTQSGGRAAPMIGMGDLVTGRYRFLHDMERPGMLHARVVRPPHARARLTALDPEIRAKLERDGLRVVRDGSFLAVAGPREWPVIRGAERLARACTWDMGGGLPEIDLFAQLTGANALRMQVVDGTPREGEIPPPLTAPTHGARYERPYTMHGALAPSAALAEWDGTALHLTTHSQGIYPLRQSIAESLELATDAVVVTHAPGSGCYGHNGADDAAFEAALIAQALPKTPILLKWTRADEHGWEPYGPPMAVELAAETGADGRISALSAEAIGGTFRGRPRPGAGGAGPAKLVANWLRATPIAPQAPKPNLNRQGGLHRNLDPAYAIPRTRLVKNLVGDLPLRSSALRCLGAAVNVFALESFMDEMAALAGADPFDFRRAQLTDPRGRDVLERLRIELGPAPETGGRGIAYAQYKNAMTRVALGVDLDVTDNAEVRLGRMVIVADAGGVVDRDGLEAQLEGGALQAASWALHETVTWDRDGVTSRDWETYPILRFDNVPEIRTVLMDRAGDPPLGAGEASSGPAIAAIANAVQAATGLRLRRLPFTPEAIAAQALAE